MKTDVRMRLTLLNGLIKKEKDPKELMKMVLEVLHLYDEMDGTKPQEKPNEQTLRRIG